MLIIRDVQLAAVAESLDERFRRQLARYVKAEFRDECADMTDERLRVTIEDGVALGMSYGLEEEQQLSRFVVLQFTAGQEFDREPWAARILGDRGRDPEERLEALERAVAETS
jgi:hypothetical protein